MYIVGLNTIPFLLALYYSAYMEAEKTLKEKVFDVCDAIANSGGKVIRDKVRECTKGSDRDISKYIAEWKASKETAITVTETSTLSQQEQESAAISDKSVPNSVPSAQAYSTTPEDDIALVARRGAERAAAMLAAEDAVVGYLLENPNQLPADLRVTVEETRAKLNQTVESRQEQYNPDFFAQMAIAQFQ